MRTLLDFVSFPFNSHLRSSERPISVDISSMAHRFFLRTHNGELLGIWMSFLSSMAKHCFIRAAISMSRTLLLGIVPTSCGRCGLGNFSDISMITSI